MAWRDNLRPASFRGIQFHVDAVDGEFGRRTVLHEYPQRNKPHNEDLGRATRSFTFSAYLIGTDHDDQARSLIEAVERAGAGELVHPFLGTIRGICTLRVRQSVTTDGGMSRLQIAFTEEGENEFPNQTIDRVSSVDAAAGLSFDSITDVFVNGFSLAGAASYVIDAANSLLKDVNSTIAGVIQPLVAGSDVAADVARQIRELDSLADDIRNAPREYANALENVMSSALGVADYEVMTRSLTNLSTSYGNDLDEVQRTTPQRIMQADNQSAILELVRDQTVVEAARSLVRGQDEVDAIVIGQRTGQTSAGDLLDAPWLTYDEAVEIRDEVAAAMDQRMLETSSDSIYRTVGGLRVLIVETIPGDNDQLPRLSSYTPEETEPSLVSAYRLYADAARGSEVAVRNAVRHPGFLPGGKPLEVLTNG